MSEMKKSIEMIRNEEKWESEESEKATPRLFDVGIEFVDIKNEDQQRLVKVIERISKNNP